MRGLHPATPENGISKCVGSRAKDQRGLLRDEQGGPLRAGGCDQLVMDVLDPLDEFQTGGTSSDSLHRRPPPPAFLASALGLPWRQQLAAYSHPLLSSLSLRPVHLLVPLGSGCPGAEVAKKRRQGPGQHLPVLESGQDTRHGQQGGSGCPCCPRSRPPLCPSGLLGWLGQSWGREEGWGAQMGLTGRSQRKSTACGIGFQELKVTSSGQPATVGHPAAQAPFCCFI